MASVIAHFKLTSSKKLYAAAVYSLPALVHRLSRRTKTLNRQLAAFCSKNFLGFWGFKKGFSEN